MQKALYIPTLEDIKKAKQRISKYLLKTPLRYSEPLSKLIGAEVYIKYENHNPTCAFKVRGGVNYVLKLTSQEGGVCNERSSHDLTLLAGSTGNHGQSIAYAGKLFNIPVVIAAPVGANSAKVQAMKDLGAEVVLYGKDVAETWNYCEKLAKEKNYTYVHSVDQPELFEGVGTIGLEVFEDLPDVDCFITATGGGSGLCGSSIALKNLNPKIKTYGVQASGAPAVYDSFKQKKLISHPSLNTFAEGLATRSTFEYAFNIMQKYVDDMFVVSDDEIKKSILLLLEHTHNLAEGAGAASLAGLIKNKEIFKGKKVVCVLTGGNLQMNVLREILSNESK
jgi:threonine dehydratase